MGALKEKTVLSVFAHGLRDGLPIGLGYFAVAFSLGITARNVGFSALQGFWLSLLNIASAGEYAGIRQVAAGATYLETALVILVTNARYLLMSAALGQHLPPDIKLRHRFLLGIGVTDELFGIGIAYPGYLRPEYLYGAFLAAIPLWAVGTSIGILAGNLLSDMVVRALSVAIFGMFLAIIIPPSKQNPVVRLCVIVSFAASFLWDMIPMVNTLTGGTKTILLTVLIAGAAALLHPVDEEVGA